VIPAGWRQEGHPATKTLLQFLFNLIWLSTKMGGVQPVVPRGQPHLPTRNRTMGNPAKLQDGVPVDNEGHRPDALQGSRWGTEEYF